MNKYIENIRKSGVKYGLAAAKTPYDLSVTLAVTNEPILDETTNNDLNKTPIVKDSVLRLDPFTTSTYESSTPATSSSSDTNQNVAPPEKRQKIMDDNNVDQEFYDSIEKSKNNEAAYNSLYMDLMKLRTGRTNDDIGRTFSITRTAVTERLNKVRRAMENDFVFENVNFVLSRDQLAQRSTLLSQMLFCNGDISRPVLVLDGTYVYVQKSSNYEFQKLSYNGQKKRNFVRVMICTTTDGTIIFALGPYSATTNDAKVLKSIFENSNAFDHLAPGDVFLVDRGFRDCVEFLEEKGFNVQKPVSMAKNQKQLSTMEANKSRLVTANRYGVETRNGHFKTIFKIFQKEWNNITLPHLMADFRICAALINVYFKRIESKQDLAVPIAEQMLERLETPNELAPIVFSYAFQKNLTEFTQLRDFNELPQLTNTDLIWIALGSYQIRQAKSYCQVHFKANDSEFLVFECPNSLMKKFLAKFQSSGKKLKLLMVRLNSRFRSKKSHDVFILIDLRGHDGKSVVAYCCECYNGLRTVGCCSHVMCVIWYTLHIKNPGAMPRPAAFLNGYFSDQFSSDSEEE